MRIKSNAKINLGLNVIEKRSDGFHNIESIFLPIPWYDEITIEHSDKLIFESEGISIPGNVKDNLCLKAFELIKERHQISPVKIALKKQIPIGAGLGGGSSNAAFVLKGLNEFFELNISNESLKEMASKIGSDCAFFIDNKTSFAEGRGEILTPISIQLDCYCLVVNPNIHIGTKEAYEGVILKKNSGSLLDLINQPNRSWQNQIKNDFENSVFKNHETIRNLKGSMLEYGAFYSAMSGSGSTVFGFFQEAPKQLQFIEGFQFKLFELNTD